MSKKPDEVPPEDPNLAAFRAVLAKKKNAQAPNTGPAQKGKLAQHQKPRPKERMRRRP